MSSRRPASGPASRPDPGGSRLSFDGSFDALRRLLPITVLGVIPYVLLGALIVHNSEAVFRHNDPGAFFDFHAFWNAGRAVLHGHSPYPPARSAVLAHERSFVYPAPAAILMVPFALLPFALAATLFSVALAAGIPVALWILGVRDWRCYGLAIVSAPMANAVAVAAISPLLAIPLALCWRYRERLWPAALALATAVMLKVFLWPLLLWFVFTRRARTAVAAAGLIVAVTVAAWAALGFRGFLAYPRILLLLSNLLDGKGYSLVALGRSSGLDVTIARSLPWIVGGAMLALLALGARRGGADDWTFILAVAAALALSPIVWLHYFVLLYVPIAIVRPRLAPLWLAPLPFWALPGQSVQSLLWEPARRQFDLALTPRVGRAPLIISGLVIVVGIFLFTLRASTARRRPAG